MRRRHLGIGLLSAVASAALACANNSQAGVDLVPDSGAGTDGNVTPDGFVLPESGPGPDGTPGFGFLTLDPSNAVVKINLSGAGSAGTVVYKAISTAPDGTTSDVTTATTFSLDDATLGAFSGSKFISAKALPPGVLGRTTQVHASPGNGLANLTVIALRLDLPTKDFFFVVPYEKAPDPPKDVLKFGTNIKQVDVAMLEDTSASMGGEIKNLQDGLATILGSLKAAIPNVGLAVAHFEDFPVDPFGLPGIDTPYGLLTNVTASLGKAQSAVNLLSIPSAASGEDPPESQYEAQYQLLTGEGGVTWASGGSIAASSPGWRAGSLPVVVQITDASWVSSDRYAKGGITGAHTKAQLVDAYNTKVKAKFVGVHALIKNAAGGFDPACTDFHSASCDSATGYAQAIEMAQLTGSEVEPAAFAAPCPAGKCCTGIGGAAQDPDASGKCPLVFTAKTDGTGVANGIVTAIQAISVGAAFDVTAIPSNDPSNAPDASGKAVDATKFILSLRAMDEGDAVNGCPKHLAKDTNGDGIADTFIGVTVGTPVCFEVNAKMNDFVLPTEGAQFFNAFIDVVGLPGSIKLDRRSVLFLVPPKEPPRAK